MKAVQWLSKLILSAVITSIICIASTFWVVTTYVDMILEQYHLKSAVSTTPDWSKFVTHASKQLAGFRLFGEEAGPNEGTANKTEETGNTLPVFSGQSGTGLGDQDVTNNGGDGGSSTSQPQPPSTGSSSQRKPPEDAVAVFGHQSGLEEMNGSGAGSSRGSSAGGTNDPDGTGTDAAGAAQNQNGGSGTTGSSSGAGAVSGISDSEASGEIVVSGEEFTKKKEQLSTEAKNQIFNLMVKRVPQAEMQTISKLMEDGITASELKEIEQLLQKYLKPEEYSQLLGLIKQQ